MSVQTAVATAHPLDRQVRLTLQIAMVIFVWTISIGILNGLDLMEFSREQLLSHLHGGTLGWMTLAIIGVTQWLFADGTTPPSEQSAKTIRFFAYLACVAIPLYVAAFATTFGVLRPIAGSATLVALTGIAFWTYARAGSVTITVPRLLVILGLTSSMLGGMFGVINGFAIAFDWTWVPESFFEAHPGTMEIGFVMPVAMGLAEWGMRIGEEDVPTTRLGKVQAVLVMIGFVWVLGFILAAQDEVVGLGILFGIIAIIIFYIRMRHHIKRISWTARGPGRHAVAGGILLGITFVYIFTIITMAQGDFNAIPRGQLLSFIHLMAIGGTTNALLAFVIHLVRRASPPSVVDDAVFWGLNIGLVGFVVSLTLELDGLVFVFVPIMGLALLLAIATYLPQLNKAPATP